MRISNAFYTYDLVFLFVVIYLKISAAWGRGKYFSDYEYPEIQQLFIPKEESNGEGSKTENIRTAQDSFVIDTDGNAFPETSEQLKLSNEQISKPWMRGPYADYIKKQKASNGNKKIINAGEIKLNLQSEAPHNNQFRDDVQKRQFWKKTDETRKQLSDIVKSHQKSDSELSNELQPRKSRYRKRVRAKNHNRIYSHREDTNKRFKNHLVKAWYDYDADLPPYEGSDSGIGIEPKQKLNNVSDTFFSDSRMLPEYEGNVQDYEDFNGLLNKNEAMSINNQPSTASAIRQTKVEVMSSAKHLYEGSAVLSKNIEIKNSRSTARNEPISAEPPHVEITKSCQGTVNDEVKLINRALSSSKGNSFPISEAPSLAASTSKFVSVQEMNLQQSILNPNASQNDKEINKDNGMILGQPNKVLQENHQLLAKPPVKIAGTLMEKHSEDDNESNVEEKGDKMVKVAPINSIIQSSTVLASSTMPEILKNNILNSAHKQVISNTVQLVDNYDTSRKEKRNVNENKTVETKEAIRLKLDSISPPEKVSDKKTLEKNRHSELMDAPSDIDTDEASDCSKSNKFIKPQYYALSKSNSAIGMINNLMLKLKPGPSVKKKKFQGEKLNGSLKRNAPLTYDLSYNLGYDYYKNKDGKKSDPIRTYYDYENDYDLDYKDKEYPRASHLNRTALAAEKELDDYVGNSYFINLSRNNNKSKRKKYRKVDESFRDIFGHPLSLDDPELQIVRDDDDELVKRRMHHKNFVNKHHRDMLAEKPQYEKDSSAKVQSMPRSHLKKKKRE